MNRRTCYEEDHWLEGVWAPNGMTLFSPLQWEEEEEELAGQAQEELEKSDKIINIIN